MQHNDYIPDVELEAITWARNFAKAAEQNLAEVGLTQDEVDALKALTDEFAEAKKETMEAHARAKAATIAKDLSRQRMLREARRLAQAARNSSSVPNGLLAKLGLTPKEPRRHRVLPEQPADLSVTPNANGNVKLKWSRNGNPKGTAFMVEARPGPGGEWAFIGMSMKPTFLDRRLPGERTDYRVYAQRTTYRSPASDVASVYAANPWVQVKGLAA